MGGDGGTRASNRRYMRGAGTADHTADSKRASASELAEAERDRLRQYMSTCAVGGDALDFSPDKADDMAQSSSLTGVSRADLVACPYGRLYAREAAVEALLRRMEQQRQSEEEPEIGWHVRGLKDLHPVRFQVVKKAAEDSDCGDRRDKGAAATRYVPTCPITGLELTGTVPAFLIVRKKDKKRSKKSYSPKSVDESEECQPNVLSERAIKEMGLPALQDEYGPFEANDMIRLAPPLAGGVFEAVKMELEQRREDERVSKKSKKGDKKRKKEGSGRKVDEGNSEKKRHTPPTSVAAEKKPKPNEGGSNAAQTARSSVAVAVASNPVLSSLFSNGKKMTEKEKKDNLFAR